MGAKARKSELAMMAIAVLLMPLSLVLAALGGLVRGVRFEWSSSTWFIRNLWIGQVALDRRSRERFLQKFSMTRHATPGRPTGEAET